MLIPPSPLQARLDAARPGDVIDLPPGELRCKVMITVPGVTLRGAGADKSVIRWDDYARKEVEPGMGYNTFRTWTVAVCAEGVRVEDLSIVNDALRPEEKGQEVALSVYGDDFHMARCRLSSTQDTLFVGPLPRDLLERYDGFLPDMLRRDILCRQTFEDCLIEGTVDFIFGCGQALFERCELRSLADARGHGYIAAPAHALEQTEGFRFHACRLTAAPGVAPGSVYLARPWRDYGMCEFDGCVIEGGHIAAEGFNKWNDTQRDKTARFYETPLPPGRVSWAKTKP